MENLNQPIDLTNLDAYYQREFQLIHDSNGGYRGKWNWWAFFFTGIWCLFKGCWLVGIFALISVSFFVYKIELGPGVYLQFGFSNLIWSLLLGWRGNWLYYNVKIKGKQIP